MALKHACADGLPGVAVPRRIHYSLVDSTQDIASTLAREGAATGVSVVADTQTQGRGRAGRGWSSPRGGLYMSVVTRTEPSGLPLLSLSVGVALRELLSQKVNVALAVKWPNDVVVPPEDEVRGLPRKVGGVLVDTVVRAGFPPIAVVGIGVNVKSRSADLPPEVRDRAAFLEELGAPDSPESLEAPVRDTILRASDRVATAEGRTAVIAELTPVLWGVGRPVRAENVEGIFRGVGPEGEAWVESSNGVKVAVRTGEFLLEAP